MQLKDIKDPKDIKTLSIKELESLSQEIRHFLVDSISKTGGHLASNLGAVELSIALHYVFESPKDQFIFDVGHQSYTHKILTGRASQFETLRQHQGLSGYINYQESIHDVWESGHAGTAVSALHGVLKAKQLKQEAGTAIALVGDGSITSGMSFEALNLLGSDPTLKGIVILNDNNMSISKNVGALSKVLTLLRGNRFLMKLRNGIARITPNLMVRIYRRFKRMIKAFFQSGNVFEELGYVYIGPIDGNDLKTVIKTLKQAQKMKKSVVIHAVTEKGKGYEVAATDNDGKFHGVGSFDKSTGNPTKINHQGMTSFSEVISTAMIAYQHIQKTFVVMPAMLVGTKFEKFYQQFPDRLIDVGIAEEHAATMASALSRNGIQVFLPLYATFSQRAYDQIMNDIARSDTKVIFGIDRAGFVGDDGSTHQGLYDVSMFHSMPNVVITMPYDAKEAFDLLHYGFSQSHPFVIRYPRLETPFDSNHLPSFDPITLSWPILSEGIAQVWISYGPGLDLLQKAKSTLHIDARIINARFIRPMDLTTLKQALDLNVPVFVYEEAFGSGTLYHHILDYMAKEGYHQKISNMSVKDIIHHGSRTHNQMDAKMDLTALMEALKDL